MSDTPQGEGWWQASDLKWYPPELHPDRQTLPAPPTPPPPSTADAAVIADDLAVAEGPEGIDPASPASDDASGGSGRSRTILVGVGALVLMAGLGLLMLRMFGGSGAGADSPEAAVDQLLASIAEGDAVGLASVFDPDEIGAMYSVYQPSIERLDSLGDGQTDVSAFEAGELYERLSDMFDIQVTGPDGGDLAYEVEPLGTTGRISRVRLDGLAITVNKQDGADVLVIGQGGQVAGVDLAAIDTTRLEVRDERGGLDVAMWTPRDGRQGAFLNDWHVDLITVNKDGRWYISAGYTLIELVRDRSPFDDGPEPSFGLAYTRVDDQSAGADEPEAAVRELVGAIERLDHDAAIRLTDPYGLPYLHDYQVLWDHEVDTAELHEMASEFDLDVDRLELSQTEWNGHTIVMIDDVAGRLDGGSFDIDVEQWCIDAQSPDGERIEGCLADLIAEGLAEAGVTDIDPNEFMPDRLGIAVVERNGRWFIDPIATYGHLIDQFLDIAIELMDTLGPDGFDGPMGAAAFTSGLSSGGALVVIEGELVSAGSASMEPVDNMTAFAFDLSGYPMVSTEEQGSFANGPVPVSLLRIDAAAGSRAAGAIPLDGSEWGVVVGGSTDEFVYPALTIHSSEEVTVEMVEPDIITVDSLPWTGSIEGGGRPLLLVMDTPDTNDWHVEGAAALHTVSHWQTNEVFLPSDEPGLGSFGSWDTRFAVVTGEPGDTIVVTGASPFGTDESPDQGAPEQVPDPMPTDIGHPRADLFAEVVGAEGYDFSFDQPGGYFDGCGPDDPDVTTYGFEAYDRPGLLMITPFPSEARATQAFEALASMQSPCDGFPGLEIRSIDRDPTSNSLTVVFGYDDDPDSAPSYEWYAQRGSSIVVATGTSYDDVLRGWELLNDFPG